MQAEARTGVLTVVSTLHTFPKLRKARPEEEVLSAAEKRWQVPSLKCTALKCIRYPNLQDLKIAVASASGRN